MDNLEEEFVDASESIPVLKERITELEQTDVEKERKLCSMAATLERIKELEADRHPCINVMSERIEELERDVERLRAKNVSVEEYNRSLNAEVVRLRKALRWIVAEGDYTNPDGMKATARDALRLEGE